MEDSLKIFKAKARLMVAVPLALFFDFIVFRLWINKALMVYSAIPLSAGRSIILWMRGLPLVFPQE
jgi:hypothetical protein